MERIVKKVKPKKKMKSSNVLKNDYKNEPRKSGMKRDSTYVEKDKQPIVAAAENFKSARNINFNYSMTLSHLDLNWFNFDEQEKESSHSSNQKKKSVSSSSKSRELKDTSIHKSKMQRKTKQYL